MRLLQPLHLDGATTEGLNMVPTKEFFKAVLVFVAPLSLDNAKILGCDYLYDSHGNPHHFEGTHRPQGEESGAVIQLSKQLELATEKVGKFGIFLVEGELQLRLRAHLKEMEEQEIASLFRFLARLNKDGYLLGVLPAQASFVPGFAGEASATAAPQAWPEPEDGGYFPFEKCALRPFSARKLKATVAVIQTGEDQFLFGWKLDCQFRDPVMASKMPNITDTVYPTHAVALEKGAYELFDTVQMKVTTTTAAESKAHSELIDYLVDMDPSLKVTG
jgi:hypothetical protein